MTRGWFDLFRDNGGPALYPESNRTSGLFTIYQLILTFCFTWNQLFVYQIFSVVGDVQAITVYIVFATLLVAFLVVMPGIRAQVCLHFVKPLFFIFFTYLYIIWLKLFIYVPTFFSEIHYIYKCGSEFVCWREHIRYIP